MIIIYMYLKTVRREMMNKSRGPLRADDWSTGTRMNNMSIENYTLQNKESAIFSTKDTSIHFWDYGNL